MLTLVSLATVCLEFDHDSPSKTAPLVLYNLTTLLSMRSRIAAKDPSLSHAVALLRADAELAMSAQAWTEGPGPWSVTQQSIVASSGDVHDYFSTAKYCWPCNTICNATVENATGNTCEDWTKGSDYHPHPCDNATGLPWLCHDGYANPINDQLGRGLWDSLCYTAPPLALSAFLTGNATQAVRVAMLLRTWFLAPATAMRPNLNHAQAVPGSNNGTGGGIIDMSDHHKMIDILDAATLIGSSPDPAVAKQWSAADASGMRAWISNFSKWINNAHASHSERDASNNHGTWHDVLSLGLNLYSGSDDALNAATKTCKDYLAKRIAVQVQPSGASLKDGGPGAGALPMEDGRTNSESYHSQDADGLLTIADLCRSRVLPPAPESDDLLHKRVLCNSRKRGKWKWDSPCENNASATVGVRDIVHWAAEHAGVVNTSTKWPFPQITSGDFPFYWAQIFRRAANLYQDASFEALVLKLPYASGVSPRYVLDLTEPSFLAS